jgi:hypothetical protein
VLCVAGGCSPTHDIEEATRAGVRERLAAERARLDAMTPEEPDVDNRTTSELMETLGNDVSRSHRELMTSLEIGAQANGPAEFEYEYHARKFIRAVFVFIEGVTFSVKVWSAK